MSNDFDFSSPSSSGKRIDYKKTFFNANEGTNELRIVDLRGKSFKVHYIKDINGKKVFVKSPGPGDPLIVEGNKPRTRYYLKVIDRASGMLKVWEFGSQIRQAIEEFISDLKAEREKKADDGNLLTNYNLTLRKRSPGSNPLYTLSLSQRLTDSQLEEDQEIIDNDDIDFEPLLRPWSIERIKEQILGIGGSGGGSEQDTSFDTEQMEREAQAESKKEGPQPERETVPAKKVMDEAESASDSWLDD